MLYWKLEPGGGTALYDAVIATAGQFKFHKRVAADTKPPYHYWLLVITDGADQHSTVTELKVREYLETVHEKLSNFHITVLAVLDDKTEEQKVLCKDTLETMHRMVKHGGGWGEVMKVKNAENALKTKMAEITRRKMEQFAIIETTTVIKSTSVQKIGGGGGSGANKAEKVITDTSGKSAVVGAIAANPAGKAFSDAQKAVGATAANPTVCRGWAANGSCKRGVGCAFQHPPVVVSAGKFSSSVKGASSVFSINRFCTGCGSKLQSNARFCGSCGIRLGSYF